MNYGTRYAHTVFTLVAIFYIFFPFYENNYFIEGVSSLQIQTMQKRRRTFKFAFRLNLTLWIDVKYNGKINQISKPSAEKMTLRSSLGVIYDQKLFVYSNQVFRRFLLLKSDHQQYFLNCIIKTVGDFFPFHFSSPGTGRIIEQEIIIIKKIKKKTTDKTMENMQHIDQRKCNVVFMTNADKLKIKSRLGKYNIFGIKYYKMRPTTVLFYLLAVSLLTN